MTFITLTTFLKADRNFLLVSISFFSMVPRKSFRKLDSSKSGMLESEVKAAFILASSDAEEFKTLLSFEARGLLGLFEIDNDGESGVLASSIVFIFPESYSLIFLRFYGISRNSWSRLTDVSPFNAITKYLACLLSSFGWYSENYLPIDYR